MAQAAYTITNTIAPRMEFYAVDGKGSTRVRVFDTEGNVQWELDIGQATWAAIVAAMGSSGNNSTAGVAYLPGNDNSWKGDGSLNSGGKISPVPWPGDTTVH